MCWDVQVLCFELMEASKGRYSDSVLQLMTDSADELVKELVAKMEVVSILQKLNLFLNLHQSFLGACSKPRFSFFMHFFLGTLMNSFHESYFKIGMTLIHNTFFDRILYARFSMKQLDSQLFRKIHHQTEAASIHSIP